jgi:hypothetical protein
MRSELTPEGTVRQARPEREKLKKLAATPQMDLFASVAAPTT